MYAKHAKQNIQLHSKYSYQKSYTLGRHAKNKKKTMDTCTNEINIPIISVFKMILARQPYIIVT